jgi:putative YphP/YqiW family bacilliredoxin
MPYSELMVAPMRRDLVRIGFKEMRTPEDVEGLLESAGTVLVAVNSVCGCSAGAMRPGVALALQHPTRPNLLTTVFAGQELEATEKAREYLTGYPPSSPSVALLKDGELVFMMERHQIEGHSPQEIAQELQAAFDEHCA